LWSISGGIPPSPEKKAQEKIKEVDKFLENLEKKCDRIKFSQSSIDRNVTGLLNLGR
jgi:hypothetical protein